MRATSTTIPGTTATSTRTTTPKRPSRGRHDPAAGLAIAAAVVWSLAAFGGAYEWTLPPIFLLVGVAAILVRPRIAHGGDRPIDLALLALLAAAVAQLVPLAPSWRNAASPHAAVVDAFLRIAPAIRAPDWQPLTLDPAATMTWLPVGIAAVVLFWTARELFARYGLRRTARTIAWVGLVASPLAVAQVATAPHLIYWYWNPLNPGGITFGPFVNRNHMATWLLLALPTTAGYAVARYHAHHRRASGLVRVLEQIGDDPKTVWLAGAAAVMLIALVTSLSRSGIAGLAAAVIFWIAIVRAMTGRVHAAAAVAGLAGALLIVLMFTNLGGLLQRLDEIHDIAGRVAIWRQTLDIIRDFPLTGTGVGSYATAMLAYQQQHQYGFFFNQAHDQYLQFAAEGGLLLGLPILIVVVAFIRRAAQTLAADSSAIFWVRVGSGAALVGVAVQSLWETGLRMPANAMLCAVVAAMAVHRDSAVR